MRTSRSGLVSASTFWSCWNTEWGSFSARSRLPFCCDPEERTEATVPAGYTSTESIAPSTVADTMVSNWFLYVTNADLLEKRLLHSALWVMRTSGFQAGVDYLVDLFLAGVAGVEELDFALFIPLLGRGAVDSDETLVDRLMGRDAEGPRGRQDHDLNLSWLRTEAAQPAVVGPVLERLFARVDREITRVQHATDLDVWGVGNAQLAGLICSAQFLTRELLTRPPLALGRSCPSAKVTLRCHSMRAVNLYPEALLRSVRVGARG